MKQTTEPGYAKINLSLNVIGRRANGYHEIDGVMQSVSLCDLVTVSYASAAELKITLSATGNPDMPTDERNLAYKAAKYFAEAAGIVGEIGIFLEKHIPMAGGLAGGSTDAAAVLRALDRLCGSPLGRDELCRLGARLGADVPFCIVGGCMRTQGIGDVLTPCTPMPACSVVIARRGEGVSTPWAYGRLDELYGAFADPNILPDAGLDRLLAALEKGELSAVAGSIYNIFEAPVAAVQQDVGALIGLMKESGAVASHMSGSGPSVFGIFADRETAVKACRKLLQMGADAHVCAPIATEFAGC